MRNRNAVKRVLTSCAVVVLILTACDQNSGAPSSQANPIQPAMADTIGSSLDLTIPLDVAVAASNPHRFAVRGKYIAIDPGSTGQANLRLNSISDTARLAYPGSTFSPGDFIDLYFDYPAQPGKFLHVLYGDSPDILSAGNRIAVDAAISPNIYELYSTVSNTQTIITAAQNIHGIKIIGGIVSARTGGVAGTPMIIIFYLDVAGVQFYQLAEAHIAGVAGTDLGAVSVISPIYIPPGRDLRITYQIPTVGNKVTAVLNYEML